MVYFHLVFSTVDLFSSSLVPRSFYLPLLLIHNCTKYFYSVVIHRYDAYYIYKNKPLPKQIEERKKVESYISTEENQEEEVISPSNPEVPKEKGECFIH